MWSPEVKLFPEFPNRVTRWRRSSRRLVTWVVTVALLGPSLVPVTASSRTSTKKRLPAGNARKAAKAPPAAAPAQVRNAFPLVTVSGASYEPQAVAPEAIVSGFGTSLATGSEGAKDIPLPITLAGTTITVTDSNGVGRPAPLFYVSPLQVNYLIPAGTAAGAATVEVRSGNGTISQGTVQVSAVGPGLFTETQDGKGVVAADLLRVKADGTQSIERLSEVNPATGRITTRPLDLGPATDRVFLQLYLTGVRGAADPNQDGNANETVRLLLGGTEYTPLYAGKQPQYVGLDQVNSPELPRSLAGRGKLSLAIAIPGVVTSNLGEIEIAPLAGSTPPTITSFSPTTVTAGEELTINGSGFAANATDNTVRIGGLEADVTSAAPAQLKVRVPFGAESSRVTVRTTGGEGKSASAVTVRTSISGIIETTARQPLSGVTVRVSNSSLTATTNAEGAFVLLNPPTGTVQLELDASAVPSATSYPKVTLPLDVVSQRDNAFTQPIALQPSSNVSLTISAAGLAEPATLAATAEPPRGAQTEAIQAEQVGLEVPVGARITLANGSNSGSISLSVVANARTPVKFPAGFASRTVAQITPVGAHLDLGGKLRFPNADGYAAGETVKLFHLEQRKDYPNFGRFIELGVATVSSDGQRIDTADGAITETGYYFVAGTRPTTTIIGHVVEEDGRPVRRVLVRTRGHEAITDGQGGFVLRQVPVKSGDTVTLDVTYQRPQGRIERTERVNVPVTLNGLTTVTPDIVLPKPGSNRPPLVLAPTSLKAVGGQTSEVEFTALERDAGQTLQVTVTGASFVSVVNRGDNKYALRMTPSLADVKDYALTVTATDNFTPPATTILPVALSVLPAAPQITDFSPKSACVGSTVVISGVSLKVGTSNPVVSFAGAEGRRIQALVNAATSTEVRVTVPNGAVSGTLELSTDAGGPARSNTSFSAEPTQDFTLLMSPGTATAVQGTTATYIVSATNNSKCSTADLTQLIALSVEGLPGGAKASFNPENITAGAQSTLSIVLPGNINPTSYSLTIKGKTKVDGNDQERTAAASLNVQATGQTTLSGRVLSTKNEPILNATVSLDGKSATTDAAGAFLLVGITQGVDRPVMVDGRTASAPGRTYPLINEPVTVLAGQANVVPYTFYLPVIAVENEQPVIPNQTTMITTPEVQGLALTIPANAGLRNRDGSPITRVSLSCVEIDRTPAPLPSDVGTNMVYTAQPGGARPAPGVVMPVIYPNLAGANPGTTIDLLAFDHDTARWYVYGQGKVSKDGRTIVPNPGVGLRDFSWHTPRVKPEDPRPGPCGPGECCAGPSPTTGANGGGLPFPGMGGGGLFPGFGSFSTPVGGGGSSLDAGGIGSLGGFSSFGASVGGSGGGGGARGAASLGLVATGRTANMVDLASGLKIEAATDIAFGGARGGLALARLYTTDLATTCDGCPFGRGMTHNYAIRLSGTFEKDGAGRVLMPGEIDGRLFSYLRTDGDGALVFGTTSTTVQLGDVVRKLTSGTFEYRFRSGEVMRFDATGRLTEIADRNNNKTTFEYTGGNLFRISDPVGRTITLTYEGPRIKTATDPLGRVWTYDYDGSRLKTVKDPLGFTVGYDYDTFSRLIAVKDKRTTTIKKLSYDNAGRVNKQVFADGSFERYDYVLAGTVITEAIVTNSLGRTASVRFNASGYVVGSTDPLGQTATIKRNMLTNLPEEISGPCGCVESKRQYDDKGNLKVLTDRRGQKTSFEYDPIFNHLIQVTDRLGRVSKWGYDSKGNVTSFTDALERKTTFGPDGFGVLRTIEDPLRHVTTLEYDDAGFLKKVTDPLMNATLYEFDQVGRLKKATDGEGRIVTLGYDNNDRLTSVTDPAGIETTFDYDQNANLKKVINKLKRTWTFDYDLKNRLIRATDPLNKAVQYRYNTDNELTAMLSPSARVVRYEYDQRGQVRKMIEPNGNEIQFGYDHVGNLLTLRDQRGSLTTFGYDDLYRMNAERDPLGRTSSYQFDAVGNLTEVRDRLNRIVTIKPDKLNRPETVIFRDATVTYKYDEAYRLKRIEDTASGDAPPTFVEWDYDDANRVKSETTPQGIVKYEYNKAHQRRTMTAADRPVVNYSYDPAGRLRTITQGVETFTWSYDELSRMEKLERPNGVTTTYGYDEADKLARLTHKNAAGFALEDFQYSYTPDDEIEAIVSLASPQLLPSAKTANTADAANRIPQFGKASYTFDEVGQTTTKTDEKGATQYAWDARGRLTKVTLPNGQTVSYGYDALGRRNSRTANGATTQFMYDGLDVVLDRNNDNLVDYLNGFGIDEKLRQKDSLQGSLYFLRDHLGSTTALSNGTGATVEKIQYETFGSSSSFLSSRFGYTGREVDSVTGLIHYRARWGDPALGSFITQDPLGFNGGLNLYSYGNNDPVNYKDPDGNIPILAIAALAGISAVTAAGVTLYNGGSWSDAGRAALIAGVSGGVTGAIGLGGGFFGGAIAGALGNLAGQGIGLGLGWQCNFDANGLGIAAGLGGLAGIANLFIPRTGIVPVTRWGRPGLMPGDWIMPGGKSISNYLLSFKWQPAWFPGKNMPASFGSGQTFPVPASSIHLPSGWGADGWIKGVFFGQGIYRP